MGKHNHRHQDQEIPKLRGQIEVLEKKLTDRDRELNDFKSRLEIAEELLKDFEDLKPLRQDLTQAKHKASEIEQNAQNAAAGLIEAAEAEAKKTKDAAETEAKELRNNAALEKSNAVQEAERIKGEAETERKRILADEENIRQSYFNERNAEIDKLKQTAEQSAQQILQDAEQRAKGILSDAENQQLEIIGKAKEGATGLRLQIEQELRQEYDSKTKELDDREDALNLRDQEFTASQKQLQLEQTSFKYEKEDLQFNRSEFDKLWLKCSPSRLQVLELEKEQHREKLNHANSTIADLQAQIQSLQKQQIALAGRPISALVDDLKLSQSRQRELQQRLEVYPSEEGLCIIRQQASEAESHRARNRQLLEQVEDLKDKLSSVQLSARELDRLRKERESLVEINNSLTEAIQYQTDTLKQSSGHRFPDLMRLDTEHTPTSRPAVRLRKKLSLTTLVQHVRNFAASSHNPPLYYSETDIRTFVAGLASSRLMILQGLSGTGKTSLPRVFAEAIQGHSETIPVQSNWRDRHELLGYYNDFNKRFTETEFTKAVYKASLPSEDDVPWFVILDEMNLARIEYYFADFLSVLEDPDRENWSVPLMSFGSQSHDGDGPAQLLEGYKLTVPKNLWFIGTANQDESTFEVTDKVYDRAQVIDFRERQERFSGSEIPGELAIPSSFLEKAFEEARQDTSLHLEAVHNQFMGNLDAFLTLKFDITFGNRIRKQIDDFVPVFVASGGTREEALDIQIARKILRKLENRYEPGMDKILKELKVEFNAFPNYSKRRPAHSLKVIERKLDKMAGRES